MTTSLPTPSLPTSATLCSALDRARTAWLAGDASAWDRYQTYLRQLEAQLWAGDRLRTDRRATRPGARA